MYHILGGDIYIQGPLWPTLVIDKYLLRDNNWKILYDVGTSLLLSLYGNVVFLPERL